MSYAVHALLGIVDGQTIEMSTEARDIDDALACVRQAVEEHPDFRVVAVMHVEDLPAMLDGSRDGWPGDGG